MTTTEHKEECELCGEIFIQKIDERDGPGEFPMVLNQYCDKCILALKIKEDLEKKLQHEEWIRIRDKILKLNSKIK